MAIALKKRTTLIKKHQVDLSSIKAIAHDGLTLQILIERDGSYCLQSLPAPPQVFQGLQQLAQFTTLLQQSDNGLTARTQLLDQIWMIPVNSGNGCDLDLIRLGSNREAILVELIPELIPSS